MNFLSRPITSERLEEKGQNLYIAGKKYMFLGFLGFVLLALSCIITGIIGNSGWIIDLLMFDISSRFWFMYLIMPVAYIFILLGFCGIPMYFNGLNLFALGRIAHNTEKEKDFKKTSINNTKNTTYKNTAKPRKEVKKNEADDYDSDYIDVYCPFCKNKLSFNVNIDYTDSLECPYCNNKIKVNNH